MSKTVPFPINDFPYQNSDILALDNLSSELWDGYIQIVEDNKISYKRPGLRTKLILDSFKSIDGLYWWIKKQALIVVSDGKIFKIINESGTLVDLTGDPLTGTANRATFTDNGGYLVIANGSQMVYTDGTASTIAITDSDAPQNVTHVVFYDQYILANNVGSGQIHFANFSGVAPTDWQALDVFTAESDPDDVVSLYVNKRTIIVIGSVSTEFFFDDATTPFSRIQGATYARGGMAPYSTVFANEIGFLFDDKRRLCRLEGVTPQILSTPFDKLIQGFETVSDATADYVTVLGRHFLLFSFPTENQTLVYDFQTDYWCRWSEFDSSTSSRNRFLGGCYAYANGWNLHFFGSWKYSNIFTMNENFYNDDEQKIHWEKTMGFLNHGSDQYKKISYGLVIRIKSGVGFGDGHNEEGKLLIRYRDDGNSEWSNYRYIALKPQGKTAFLYKIRNFGSYYSRQYQFKMSDPIPLVIGESSEVIDVNDF